MIQRLFPHLLLSLMLLTAACSKNKKEPEPAPTIEGKWVVKNQEYNVFRADGSEVSKSGLKAVQYRWTYAFTASTLTMQDGPATYLYDYKLNNQVLTLFPSNSVFSGAFDQTIVELTKTNLTLQDRRKNSAGEVFTAIIYLVRE